MDKKNDKPSANKPSKRVIVIGAAILTVLLTVLLVAQLATPKRSIAAYCQTYKDEKARLATLPGDTWPSGVFDDAISDAGEFATAFDRLAKVAPDEIRPDVATLQSVYQSIKDNPAGAVSASLSGTGAENSVKNWTSTNCRTTD